MMTPRAFRKLGYGAGAFVTLFSGVICYRYFAHHDADLFPLLLLLPAIAAICFVAGHSPRLGRECQLLFAVVALIACFSLAVSPDADFGRRFMWSIMTIGPAIGIFRTVSKLRRSQDRLM